MLPFTLEERKQIEKLLKAGNDFSAIHTITGRSKNGIANEVRKNGGTYEYDAVKAHKRAEQAQTKKAAPSLKNHESRGIDERVAELEKQVAYLLEQVENLKR
jgi:IS30 family transposase